MSFEPDPKQTLYMLRLVFGPAEPKLKDVELKPAALRQQLEAAGLIRLEKRGRQQHVLVTDKGWQWMQAHLHAPINPAGVNPGRVLLALLPKLQRFLERKGSALGELFDSEGARPVPMSQPPTQRAHAALLALGSGKLRERLTLAQAREALPELSRDTFDAALLQLQESGNVALYHEDSPEKRNAAVEAGAIRVAGSQYHLVYLLK